MQARDGRSRTLRHDIFQPVRVTENEHRIRQSYPVLLSNRLYTFVNYKYYRVLLNNTVVGWGHFTILSLHAIRRRYGGMKMLKANEIVPARMKNVIPEMCKGRIYINLAEGMEFEITGIVINVYPAKGEDGEAMETKDGKMIVRRTGYFNIGDMGYSSVSGYTAIEQLVSCAPEVLDNMEPGNYEIADIAPIRVSTITVKEKMGKSEYPYMAFDPKE